MKKRQPGKGYSAKAIDFYTRRLMVGQIHFAALPKCDRTYVLIAMGLYVATCDGLGPVKADYFMSLFNLSRSTVVRKLNLLCNRSPCIYRARRGRVFIYSMDRTKCHYEDQDCVVGWITGLIDRLDALGLSALSRLDTPEDEKPKRSTSTNESTVHTI